MLWLLLCLLTPMGMSKIATHGITSKERHIHEEVAVTTRPHIYYCRSPNMEDFTCWWHPLENLTDGEQVTYVLSYSKESTFRCSSEVLNAASHGLRPMAVCTHGTVSKDTAVSNQDKLDCAFDLARHRSQLHRLLSNSPAGVCLQPQIVFLKNSFKNE